MGLLLISIVLGGIIAAIANVKGRYGAAAFGWLLYGALLFPIALIHVLCVRPRPREERS